MLQPGTPSRAEVHVLDDRSHNWAPDLFLSNLYQQERHKQCRVQNTHYSNSLLPQQRNSLDRRTQSCSLYLSHALVSYKPSVLAFIPLVKSQACSAVWKQVPISTVAEETSWPLLRPRLLLPALEVARYRYAYHHHSNKLLHRAALYITSFSDTLRNSKLTASLC